MSSSKDQTHKEASKQASKQAGRHGVVFHEVMTVPGCLATAAPATSPEPGTMLSTPAGTPASRASSPTLRALRGVCSATCTPVEDELSIQQYHAIYGMLFDSTLCSFIQDDEMQQCIILQQAVMLYCINISYAQGSVFRQWSLCKALLCCACMQVSKRGGRNGYTEGGVTFMTTQLPAARAGPSFQAAMRMGKFQGMI